MNIKIILPFILTSAAVILAAGCSPTIVKTSWGTQVYAPKCIQQIKYSGNSLKIGEVTIPIGSDKVTIKGVDWDTKKLQDAIPAIQTMEQIRLRLCEERVIDLQTLKYEDYLDKDKKRQENQEKLDQLAYLVTLNNPQSVEKWIAAYLTTKETSVSSNATVKSLASNKNEKSEIVPNDASSVREVSTFLK